MLAFWQTSSFVTTKLKRTCCKCTPVCFLHLSDSNYSSSSFKIIVFTWGLEMCAIRKRSMATGSWLNLVDISIQHSDFAGSLRSKSRPFFNSHLQKCRPVKVQRNQGKKSVKKCARHGVLCFCCHCCVFFRCVEVLRVWRVWWHFQWDLNGGFSQCQVMRQHLRRSATWGLKDFADRK